MIFHEFDLEGIQDHITDNAKIKRDRIQEINRDLKREFEARQLPIFNFIDLFRVEIKELQVMFMHFNEDIETLEMITAETGEETGEIIELCISVINSFRKLDEQLIKYLCIEDSPAHEIAQEYEEEE